MSNVPEVNVVLKALESAPCNNRRRYLELTCYVRLLTLDIIMLKKLLEAPRAGSKTPEAIYGMAIDSFQPWSG